MTTETATLKCGCSGSFECPEAVELWRKVNDAYYGDAPQSKYDAAMDAYRSHKQ